MTPFTPDELAAIRTAATDKALMAFRLVETTTSKGERKRLRTLGNLWSEIAAKCAPTEAPSNG